VTSSSSSSIHGISCWCKGRRLALCKPQIAPSSMQRQACIVVRLLTRRAALTA
jgi:hypothetical protein